MTKRTVIFLAVLLFSISLVSAAADNATFTLNAHVRGVTVHGFVQTLESLPEGVESDGLTVLEELLTKQELDALDGPTIPMLKGQNLTLGYDDIDEFDFGDETYDGVAYYLFLSNMATALKVSFTVSDFIYHSNSSITVPWELGVERVNSEALTISEGKKASGDAVHTIATTDNPLEIRWAILKLSLHFEKDVGYLSGDYTATVVASITAS